MKKFFTWVGGILVGLFVIGLVFGEDPSPQRGVVAPSGAGSASSACVRPDGVQAPQFNSSHRDTIAEASRTNEARFERDYKGRSLGDCVVFDGLERSVLGSGWTLRFKDSSRDFMAKYHCSVDDAFANRLVDVNPGEQVYLSGIIRTTSIGVLLLDRCQVQ